MPTTYNGTFEERLARLEKRQRRCDANGRRCVGVAVERFHLLKTDGFGHVQPDAQPEVRQCCSRHRAVFLLNGAWQLVSREDLKADSADRRVA